eukprot:8530296-Alexandrium_andersonii.AAC.1
MAPSAALPDADRKLSLAELGTDGAEHGTKGLTAYGPIDALHEGAAAAAGDRAALDNAGPKLSIAELGTEDPQHGIVVP